MPVTAAIQFTQGATTAPPGQALVTFALVTPVVVSNGDNTDVVWWEYELIDVPSDSTVPLGPIGGPSLPTASFAPDVRGSYCVRLTVTGLDGRTAVDVRVFAVYEVSGRLIPPFRASASAINFGGQTRGWSPYLEAYLKAVDDIVVNTTTVLDVRSFGAVGDGTTDDLAAFNAAIAAKEAAVATGKVVSIYVPSGQYFLSGPLDLGTRAFTMYGDGVHYVHQNSFGDAAWLLINDYVNGVVGSVLRWKNVTDGLKFTSYPTSGIHLADFAIIGPGSGSTTGLYEAAPTATVNMVLERLLIGNWGRGMDMGGVEQLRTYGIRIFGCVYGTVIKGTPQNTGGGTNSAYHDHQVQTCTVGMVVNTALSIGFDGHSSLFQANGKSLSITGATNASPIVLTVSSTKGLETGMRCDVTGVVGNTAANVTDNLITVVDATHISLDGTTGNGAYVSGGTIKVGGGVLLQPAIYVTALTGTGTNPPVVTLTGTPIVYPCDIEIDITPTGGARGTATFTWKLNGVVQATGQVTAATFVLGATGLTANFPVGTYSTNNVYTCSSFGHIIGFAIKEAWFEANKRFGIRFDFSNPQAAATLVTISECRLSDSSNDIDFSAVASGSGVNRLAVKDCYGGGDLIIPAGGVYGYDQGCSWSTFSNGYPAGWKHDDPTSGVLQVPTLTSNGVVSATHFDYGVGTIASTGVVRVPNNATAMAAARAGGGSDLILVSTDGADDIIFGDRVNGTDSYLYAKNRAFIGVGGAGGTPFALLVSASGYEKHAYPSLGGDGTDSVPDSMFAANGFVSTNLGDSDQSLLNTQYSRLRVEFADTWTAPRVRTLPTPANANSYLTKLFGNNSVGGFPAVLTCGGGSRYYLPAGDWGIFGLKSTGDVQRIAGSPIDYVSILDYGADPSGLTSSSTAFTNAHAAALAQGKKLMVPAGTFLLGANFTLSVPTEVVGVISGAVTLTVSAPITADAKKIFASNLTVSFTSSAGINVPWEWFGAVGDAVSATSGFACAAASTTLTGPANTFASTDVGKRIVLFKPPRVLTATAGSDATHLVVSGATFQSWGVQAGDVVWNRTENVFATVASVDSQTQLTTSAVTSWLGDVAVWQPTGSASRHVTTIAGFTNSTTVTLTAAPTRAFSGDGCSFGTDDQAAIRAAIVATRGNLRSVGQPARKYGVASSVLYLSTTGIGTKVNGNGCWLVGLAVVAGGVISTDDGTANNNNMTGCELTDLNVECSNCFDYGVLFGKLVSPTGFGGCSGDFRGLNIYHAEKNGAYLIGCQSTRFTRWFSVNAGEKGIIAVACNGTVFDKTICYNNRGASAFAGMSIDSKSGFGSGGCTLLMSGGEINTGHGIEVLDTDNIGSSVTILSPWCEGNAGNGVYIDRPGTTLRGGTYSGAGAGVSTNYPYYVTAKGHGSSIDEIQNVSGYVTQNLGGYVATGALAVRPGPGFNATTKTHFDPVIQDGWAANLQLKYRNGDVHAKGKLGLGTFAPRESIEVVSGSVLVDQGMLAAVRGGLITPHGGIGQGQNLLVRSEEFSNASWTKSSCTVTADQVAAPDETAIGGVLADKLVTTSGGFIRQDVNTNALLGYANISASGTKYYGFQVWMRSARDLTADGTGCTATTLKCASATFVTDGVPVGSRVYNATEGVYAYVVSVDSETQLTTTPVGNWTSDAFTAPQRVRLWMTAGGLTTIGNVVDVTVERDWGFFWAFGSTTNTSTSTFRVELRSPTSSTYSIYAWGASGYEDVITDNLIPQAYAKTIATARVGRAFGPVQNQPPRPPGGSFTMAAANNTVVADVRVAAGSTVKFIPTNAAASALLRAHGLYHDKASNSAGASFTVKTDDDAAAAGTETFDYELTEPWVA